MAAKILVDFSHEARDLDGEKIILKYDDSGKPVFSTWSHLVRKLIIGEVSPQTNDDIMKYFGWCGELADNKPLELDEVDFDKLKRITIESRHNMHIKGPILSIMNKSKIDSEKA